MKTMGYMEWASAKLKEMDVMDIKMIKLSVAAFTLMIAKLWPGILGLNWYWYALLGVVFMLRPLKKVLGKTGPQVPM